MEQDEAIRIYDGQDVLRKVAMDLRKEIFQLEPKELACPLTPDDIAKGEVEIPEVRQCMHGLLLLIFLTRRLCGWVGTAD